jgi:hypothetical protein
MIERRVSKSDHQLHLKNYITFGRTFSFAIEILNINMHGRKKRSARVV